MSTLLQQRYLEVTFRKGKPLAAYLYLSDDPDDKSVRMQKCEAGLVIDYAADGHGIGIEITSPTLVTLDALNRTLAMLGQEPMGADELAPLCAKKE